ncbi:GIY-YIG nuclease family protein [Patescibacteria group bacterium]|nr:GIY-YIG nuclease family protein [Patescibacteria group bacterium]MCL5091404.1 GIY-YIG nuclease family protein [Patescibacteria group bacterium]
MFFYVYILKLKNNDWYTGYTVDLRQRVVDHQRGKVRSTKAFLPVELIHYEAYKIEEDARRREKYLKTSDGKRFLKQQLSVLYSKIKT